MENVKTAQSMELNNLAELVRLVISSSQNRGGHLYFGQKNGKNIFFVTHLIPSWYDLKGLPVTVYVEVDEVPDGKFIAYRTQGNKEEQISFVHVNEDPMSMHLPIIHVKDIPNFIME